MNAAGWTEAFIDYLEFHMAAEACEAITNSASKRRELQMMEMDALKTAKSNDAMNEGIKFLPRGSWSTSRNGNRRWRDR